MWWALSENKDFGGGTCDIKKKYGRCCREIERTLGMMLQQMKGRGKDGWCRKQREERKIKGVFLNESPTRSLKDPLISLHIARDSSSNPVGGVGKVQIRLRLWNLACDGIFKALEKGYGFPLLERGYLYSLFSILPPKNMILANGFYVLPIQRVKTNIKTNIEWRHWNYR